MTSSITTREKEILQLIALEHTSDEIAHLLLISSHTVLTHRKNLISKMKVKNTAGLIREGFYRGILSIQS